MKRGSLIVINLESQNKTQFEFSLCRLLKTDEDALLLGATHHRATAWFNRFYFDFFPKNTPAIFQFTSIGMRPHYKARLTPPQIKTLGLEHTLKLRTTPLNLETLVSNTITIFGQLPN